MPDGGLQLLNLLYQQKPELFTDDEVTSLEQMNINNGIEFSRNQQAGDFNLWNTVSQVFKGFIRGFTTFDIGGDKPANEYEEIAHSLGSLLGFVGWIPGVGSLAKFGSMGVARALSWGMKADKAAGIIKGSELLSKAASGGLHIKSAPMAIADWMMKGYNKTTPMLEAVGYFKKGTMGREMIEGGLHLGLASAAGAVPLTDLSWQALVNERMNAFTSGAVMGGTFRLIGAAMPSRYPVGGNVWKRLPLSDRFSDPMAYARMISSALVTGLPSTLQGQPLSLQVYEYLLGGYFGIREMAPYQREALSITTKYSRSLDRYKLSDPETLPEWGALSEKAREELKTQADLEFGGIVNGVSRTAAMFSRASMDVMNELLAKGKISQETYNNVFMEKKFTEAKRAGEREGKTDDEIFEDQRKQYVRVMDEARKEIEIFGDMGQARLGTTEEAQRRAMEFNESLRQTYEDLNVNPGLHMSLSEIVNEITAKGIRADEKVLIQLLAESQAAPKEAEKLKGENPQVQRLEEAFERFIKSAGEKYGINIKGETKEEKEVYARFRQSWLLAGENKVMRQLTVNDWGIISDTPEIDDTGSKTIQFAPKSFFESLVISPALIKTKNVNIQVLGDESRRTRRSLRGLYDYDYQYINKELKAQEIRNEYNALLNLYEKGFAFYGGVKDKNNWQVGKLLISKEAANNKLDDFLFRHAESLPVYQKLEERFIDIFQAKDPFAREKLKETYRHLYGNQIAWREKAEGLKVDVILDPVNDGRFITKAAEMNKRFQLITDKGIMMKPLAFQHIEDAKEGLRFVNVRAVNKFMGDFAEGYKDWTYWVKATDKKTGKTSIVRKTADTMRDGGVFVRGDIFDAMMGYGGFDSETTGSAKGVIIDNSKGQGLILGKLAFHRASPELDSWLFEKGQHMMTFDTAIKQPGLSETFDARINREGKLELWKDQNTKIDMPSSGLLPPEGIRLNLTTYEPDIHNVKAVKQLLTNIRDESVQKSAFDSLISGSIFGNDKHNQMLEKYTILRSRLTGGEGDKEIKGELDKITHRIDIDLIGRQQIVDIIFNGLSDTGKVPHTKLFEKTIKHIMKDLESDPLEISEAYDAEMEAARKVLSEARRGAMGILDGLPVTPLILNHQKVASYVQAAVKNYLINRVMRPKVDFSMKVVGMPIDHFMQRKLQLKPGEYLLGEGARKKKIKFQEGIMTLEEAWERYEKAVKDKADLSVIRSMENDLTHISIRVPADSRAGARVLRFRGFTGIKGSGIMLHPEDAVNAGGMDFDMDTMFIYTDLPKGLKEYYALNKDQWVEMHGRRRVRIESKTDDEFLDPEFERLNPHMNDMAAMFDPISLLNINRSSFEGNQMLGAGLSHANRLMVLQDIAAKNNNKMPVSRAFVERLQKKGELPEDLLEIYAVVKPEGIMKLEKAKYDLVNYCADAANGHPLKSRQEVMNILDKKAFSLVKLMYKTSDGVEHTYENEITVNALRDMASMKYADNVISGRDRLTGRTYNFWEVMERLSGLNFSDDIPSIWFKALEKIGGIRINRNPDSFVGHQWKDFVDRFVKLFSLPEKTDPNAAFIRKTVLRKAMVLSPEKYLSGQYYKESILSDSERFQFERNMIMRDLELIASSFTLHEAGERVIKNYENENDAITRLKDIARHVEDYKLREAKRKSGLKKEAWETRVFKERNITLSDLYKEMRAYRDSLPKDEQDYFDMYMISGYTVQDVSQKAFVKNYVKEKADELLGMDMVYQARSAAKSDQPLTENDFKEWKKTKDRLKKVAVKGRERYPVLEDEAKKLWHSTPNSNLWTAEGLIAPENRIKFFEKLNEIGQATFRHVDDNVVRKVSGRPVKEEADLKNEKSVLSDAVPGSDSMNKGEVITTVIKDFAKKIPALAKADMGKADPVLQKRYDESLSVIKDVLFQHPQLLDNLEGVVQGILLEHYGWQGTKSLELLDLPDLEYVALRLKGLQRRDPSFKKIYMFLFPDKISKYTEPFDLQTYELRRVPIKGKESAGETVVNVISSTVDKSYRVWNAVFLAIDRFSKRSELEHFKRLPLFKELNKTGDAGFHLFDYMIALRDDRWARSLNKSGMPVTTRELERAKEVFEKNYKGKTFTISDAAGGTRTVSAEDVIKEMDNEITRWATNKTKLWYNKEGEAKYIDVYRDKQTGYIDIDKFFSHFSRELVEERLPPEVGLEGLSKVLHQLELEQRVIDLPGGRRAKIADLPFKDKVRELEKARLELIDEKARLLIKKSGMEESPLYEKMLEYSLKNDLFDDVNLEKTRGMKPEEIEKVTGGDKEIQTLLSFARTYKDLTEKAEKKQSEIDNWNYRKKYQTINSKNYFPHNSHGPKEMQKYLEDQILEMIGQGAAKADIARRQMHIRKKMADGHSPDGGLIDEVITAERVSEAGKRITVGSTMHRSSFDVIPGYDRTPNALLTYEKQFITAYWKIMGSSINRWLINRFEKERPLGEHTEAWSSFLQIYNRDNVGYPSLFPVEWLNNKNMKIRNNPYYWFTDDFTEKKLKWVADKVFSGIELDYKRTLRKLDEAKLAKAKGLQKDLTPDEVMVFKKEMMARKIAAFSNLEGQVELITLLANTKSLVNNIFGGSLHTIISSGLQPFRDAGSLEYLRQHGFPEAKGYDEIMAFAQEHGSTESYISTEVAINGALRSENIRAFLSDVKSEMKKARPLSDKDIAALAERRKVSLKDVLDRTTQVGAWFMRYGELKLRNRAWVAHYLQARRSMEDMGLIFERDHPWLIKLANRGVTATQFLYNNANRPAFSRTAMGKIFTRFQLWAWNSLKFRSEVLSEASSLGYRQTTPQFERLKRMMTSDLFMISLGSLFPISLFGSNVPQPYKSFLDLSAFFFGDDEKRDRVFYSEMPWPASIINMAEPPSARYLDPLFIWMVGGDWQKWAKGKMWSLFPFGRLGKNTYETLLNPTMVLENMAGFPLHKLQRMITEGRGNSL